MLPEPAVPLRWYEVWLLELLLRSPRIDRIVVYQRTAPPAPTPEPAPPAPTKPYVSYQEFLTSLYQAPSADE